MTTEAYIEGDCENENKTAGRWTAEEHSLFLEGLKLYQKQWKSIADLVKTRTVVQIRTHAQKYFQKISKNGPDCFPSELGSIERAYSEGDDFRTGNYRTNSISSCDSSDNHEKPIGRSVSMGSDPHTDSENSIYSQSMRGRNSFAHSLSPTAVQMGGLVLSVSVNNPQCFEQSTKGLRPRAVSMGDLCPGNTTRTNTQKKRSREKSVAPPINPRCLKSPKRSNSNKHIIKSEMDTHQGTTDCLNNGSSCIGEYYNFVTGINNILPFPQSKPLVFDRDYYDQQHSDPFQRAHRVSIETEEELDMINLLKRIDWISPCSSPTIASSLSIGPAAAASVSSSLSCVSGSPVTDATTSLCNNTHNNCEVTGILLSSKQDSCCHDDRFEPMIGDEFDVFDNLCSDMDIFSTNCGTASQETSLLVGNLKESNSCRTLLQQNTFRNANIKPSEPDHHWLKKSTVRLESTDVEPAAHRVWFASVIDELKTKTAQAVVAATQNSSSAEAYFPIAHSFLRPVRPKSNSGGIMSLPPLSSLSSGGAPPVVISTNSLTLMDTTFCSYPLMYATDSPSDMVSKTAAGGDYNYAHYSHDDGSVSNDSQESRFYPPQIGLSGRIALPNQQSPAAAVKKRGRPRKLPSCGDIATVTPTSLITSRSLNNLSTSSRTLSYSTSTTMATIHSQPHFPDVTLMSADGNPYRPKHSFDDFLRHSGQLRGESLFNFDPLQFPSDLSDFSVSVADLALDGDAVYHNPFQFDDQPPLLPEHDVVCDVDEQCVEKEQMMMPTMLPKVGDIISSSRELGVLSAAVDEQQHVLSDDMAYFEILGADFE